MMLTSTPKEQKLIKSSELLEKYRKEQEMKKDEDDSCCAPFLNSKKKKASVVADDLPPLSVPPPPVGVSDLVSLSHHRLGIAPSVSLRQNANKIDVKNERQPHIFNSALSNVAQRIIHNGPFAYTDLEESIQFCQSIFV